MNTLTLKISEDLERQITDAARHQHITKSELVRRAMEHYIAQNGTASTFRSPLELAGRLIGCVDNTPADLSSNPQHMDGYGR